MNWDIVLNATMGIVLLLVMFSMGLSLTPADFKRVALMPLTVALGLAAQLLFLPLVAFAVLRAMGLPEAAAVGLMLVAVCPSGPTSSFFTHISGGDLALSMTLNAGTTLLSIATLPVMFALTLLGAHANGAEVPAVFILKSMSIGVVLPTALGMSLRAWRPAAAAHAAKYSEKAGTGLILFGLAVMIIKNRAIFDDMGWELLAAVLALNVGGMVVGYALGKIFKRGLPVRKTLAFEVGLQNIPLASLLAFGLFSAEPGQLSVILAVISMYAILSILSALAGVFVFKRIPAGINAADMAESAA